MRAAIGVSLTATLGVLMAAAFACSASPAAQPALEPGRPTVVAPARPADSSPTAEPAAGASPTPLPATQAEPRMVKVPAPIESAEVQIAESDPPQYFLVVRTGLENGCVEFEGYEVTRDGNEVIVRVTNLEPDDKGIVCTDVYGTVESRIALGRQFDSDERYTVNVNGVTMALRGATIDEPVPAGAETPVPAPVEKPGPEAVSTPVGPQGMVPALAPIDAAEIEVEDAAAVEYFVKVTSGLPNGCVRFGGYAVTREGDTVLVEVTNLVPANKELMCAMVYGTVESRISVGGDFNPGRTYTVEVNGVPRHFVAQGGPAPPAEHAEKPVAALGVPFEIGLGETVTLEPEDLTVRFASVLGDSRCPANVTCIWAGEATIMVEVARRDEAPVQVEVTISGRGPQGTSGAIGGFLVKLVALEPYPGTTRGVFGAAARTTATLVVAKAG